MSPSWICQQIRNLQYGFEEQKCNPKPPALHSHGIYNPFWGDMEEGSLHWNHHSRYLLGTTPQNLLKSKILTQKWGRFLGRSIQPILTWTKSSQEAGDALVGQEGFGDLGQCLPAMCALLGRELSLPALGHSLSCPGKLPAGTQQPINLMEGALPIACTWHFRM